MLYGYKGYQIVKRYNDQNLLKIGLKGYWYIVKKQKEYTDIDNYFKTLKEAKEYIDNITE